MGIMNDWNQITDAIGKTLQDRSLVVTWKTRIWLIKEGLLCRARHFEYDDLELTITGWTHSNGSIYITSVR